MHKLQQLIPPATRASHAPHVIEGLGVAADLAQVVDRRASRVLVVASQRTATSVPAIRAMIDAGAIHYHRTRPNPAIEDALDLSAAIEQKRPEVILVVGGGSAIDQAKAGRLLLPDPTQTDDGLRGLASSLRRRPPPLVVAPTTAGTGAEVTPFATLYRGKTKVSLDIPECRPDVAVLDGSLTLSCPERHSMAAALDAMCHSIESGWSLAATATSRLYADAARDHLLAYFSRNPLSLPAVRTEDGDLPQDTAFERHLLLVAAAVAGIAIAQTRTTGAHAFGYHLTSEYGVPHGFACALSMSWLESQLRSRQPETLEPATTTAVEALRRCIDLAQAAHLLEPPGLHGKALENYVDAGLGVRSRMATHPVAMSRSEAINHIRNDGRLMATSTSDARNGYFRVTVD